MTSVAPNAGCALPLRVKAFNARMCYNALPATLLPFYFTLPTRPARAHYDSNSQDGGGVRLGRRFHHA